ncbi:calcium-binding protein [Salipiger abyssi]|uniref:Ca2+-binding protein, RTX toxin n=1 Tax=Salipiger abyssi TaxID=1250539 RepID=A0A1P8V0N6_9RHOB|nr:calcium-binding protein [Salipiger abyssi]APZ55213.1 Ca2+-binding protein, RTX toxin [Salipiger abyssi]
MALAHSPVADNSLLPFAQPGAVQVPPISASSSHAWSSWFDLGNIFEDGLTLGNQTYRGLRVFTSGEIQLGNSDGWQDTSINAYYSTSTDIRAIPDGVVNQGVWIEENTARDSVLITFNAVGQYSNDVWNTITYQVEIIDRGENDTEVIYRFNALDFPTYPSGVASYIRYDDWNYSLPVRLMPVGAQWEDLEGNTGIDGVWQLRIEDGIFDMSDVATPHEAHIGTAAPEELNGWLGGDILRGLEGDDTLDGSGGNDTITGDTGDDLIFGDIGADLINGGDGNDDIRAGPDRDSIGAGDGDDTVDGDGGHDNIYGGEGANRLIGGTGNDYITAGSDDDAIQGNNGQDTINSGAGNDTVDAGNDADTVHGGAGDDILLGGGGADYLTGGDGNDTINTGGAHVHIDRNTVLAGAGDDLVNVALGRNTVEGGEGHDEIIVHHMVGLLDAHINSNQLNGGLGDDTITGGRFHDTIGGQEGNDLLDGGNGNDSIGAGDGDDTVTGDAWDGTGHDWIYGGAGADSLYGGGGNDTIFGGEGDDTLLGSYGRDLLLGGDGDDFIFGGAGSDVAAGGAGADRFFASFRGNDVTTINDYNPDEGDVLVLDGRYFSADDLRLRGDRMTDAEGNPTGYSSMTLVRVNEDGSLGQTIFDFANASELDRIVIRMPNEPIDGIAQVEIITFDLL